MSKGRTPVVETERFQSAVAEAAAKVAAEIVDKRMAELEAKLLAAAVNPAAPVTDANGVTDIMGAILSKLSMNLQATNSKGVYNQPISPEELEKRQKAASRLVDLIGHSRTLSADERPSYKIIGKTSLNERVIEPFKEVDKKAVHNEITWTGVPNDAMVPLNDIAREIFNCWRESTGGPTLLLPTSDVRPFHMTAAGLTVKGDPPKRSRHVAAEESFADDLGLANDDPNAPQVAVLGTIAAKAKQNQAGVQ